MTNVYKLVERRREYWIGKSKNSNLIERKIASFEKLARACLTPKISKLTQAEYKDLTDDEKNHVKNTPYIMPGCYKTVYDKTTSRKTANIKWMTLLIIDIDNPREANRIFDVLYLEAYLESRNINYIAFPTFSSTPQYKRVRLMIDAHKLPTHDYIRGVATVCHWLRITPTKESLVTNQLMYLPHICKDAEYECIFYTDGRPYNVEDYDPDSDKLVGFHKTRNINTTNPKLPGHDSDIDEYYEPPLVMSPETFIDALMNVSPDVEYPEWVRRAYGQKHFWQDDDARGLEVFDQWSQLNDCPLYTGFEDCKRLWNNLSANPIGRKPITGRYIVELAQQAGWKQKHYSQSEKEQMDLDLDPEPIYPDYIKYMLDSWAYLEQDRRFVNLDQLNPSLLTKESFNHRHIRKCFSTADLTAKGRLSKRSPLPKIKPDAWLSMKNGKIYESTMYCPGSGRICEHNGKQYINTWSRRPLEVVSNFHAIQLLDVFFKWIIADDYKRQTFITILQYIVKNPGKRLKFCPVLQGAQGMGKTFLKDFMQSILGFNNVQTITTDSIQDNLTDWAGRSELTVIEEIYIPGRKRFEIVERFKPFISNNEISIRVAYVGVKTVVNPTSYIALTNHKDAIPVDCNHDRRYWVIFSSVQTREQIHEQDNAYGGPNAFFNMLWPLLDQPGACLGWLLNQTPIPNFDPAIMPSKTDDMAYMELVSKSDIEESVDDLIRERPRGIYRNVLSGKCLHDLLELEGFVTNHCRTIVSKILQKNWTRCKHNERPSIDGYKHTIWYSPAITDSAAAIGLWKKLYQGDMQEDESNIIPFEKPSDDD